MPTSVTSTSGHLSTVVKRLRKARRRLQRVFTELFLAENVIVVCVEALKHQSADNDLEVATILRRYVDSVLGEQLGKLHKVITKFGGATDFTPMDNEESDDAIIHVV